MYTQITSDTADYFNSIFDGKIDINRQDGILLNVNSEDEKFVAENISYYLDEYGIKYRLNQGIGYTWITNHDNLRTVVYNPETKKILVGHYIDTRSR